MASGGEPSWAWLGLLKWSLSYTDGTRPSSESLQPMSDEDKAFLEAVMKDGIVDEGERMKSILTDVTDALEVFKAKAAGDADIKEKLSEEDISELLLELRDIVEQIDFARAFAAMKGLPFLLGCAAERDAVPRSIRIACLGILATMCQNNPPVQYELLNDGAIKKLIDIYFAEYPNEGADVEESDGKLRERVVQALSASIREHATAEQRFCQHSDGRRVIESGLGLHSASETLPTPPLRLRKRSLFFLRALITSDSSSGDRVRLFAPSIGYVADNFLDDETEANSEMREMSLALVERILQQKNSVNVILDRKNTIAALGVRRISSLRALEGEEGEFARIELDHWESLMIELARAKRDEENQVQADEAPLMLEGSSRDTLSQ